MHENWYLAEDWYDTADSPDISVLLGCGSKQVGHAVR